MEVVAAIIGSGNIGTDLMLKILKPSQTVLTMGPLVGIDPQSDGLSRARERGVTTVSSGIEGLLEHPEFESVSIVFDATSARAHAAHEELLRKRRPEVRLIDLTPAAIGPYCIPVANLDSVLDRVNVNMVTCGGQATTPIVHAAAAICEVRYAEIVASLSSRSAGPGTRANIDEFTETTASALQLVGGAQKAKAVVILNPAEPPVLMRNTVFMLTKDGDPQLLQAAIEQRVAEVADYVPGYRLKQPVQFDEIRAGEELRLPGGEPFSGLKVSVFLEVEGAADYLPSYAGNLDIMTSAALRTAQGMAGRIAAASEAVA